MTKEIIGYTTAVTALPKTDSGPEHEYVDLGLPSGTLWATMNVGATSSTEYGDYYMYGMGSKTYDSTDTPYDGTEDPLDLTKDTARVVWGGDWHMPTKTLVNELYNNTTYSWVDDYNNTGVNGALFTAQNGNSVFIPAGGMLDNEGLWNVGSGCIYRTSSPALHDNDHTNAYVWWIAREVGKTMSTYSRNSGYLVRPVIG